MSKKRSPVLSVYRSRDGWRWRIKAANGEIVAQGENYTRLYDARRSARRFIALVLRFKDY